MKAEKSDPPEPPPRNPLRVMASITSSVSSEVNFKWRFFAASCVKTHMVIKRFYRRQLSRPKRRQTGWKLRQWTRVPRQRRIRWRLKQKKMTHRLRPSKKIQVRMRGAKKRKIHLVDAKTFRALFPAWVEGGRKKCGRKMLSVELGVKISGRHDSCCSQVEIFEEKLGSYGGTFLGSVHKKRNEGQLLCCGTFCEHLIIGNSSLTLRVRSKRRLKG